MVQYPLSDLKKDEFIMELCLFRASKIRLANYKEISKNATLPDCHSLHYLQMATEKLSKAFLLAGGEDISKIHTTHKAFIKFFLTLPKNSGLRKHLNMRYDQLKERCKILKPIVEEIEKFAPPDRSAPNPEYPWSSRLGQLEVPSKFSFPIAKELKKHSGRNLLKLIEDLIDKSYIFFTP